MHIDSADARVQVHRLTIGDYIWATDRVGKWYNAKIVDKDVDNPTFFGWVGQVRVHFLGWKARFDEWIDIRDKHRFSLRCPI